MAGKYGTESLERVEANSVNKVELSPTTHVTVETNTRSHNEDVLSMTISNVGGIEDELHTSLNSTSSLTSDNSGRASPRKSVKTQKSRKSTSLRMGSRSDPRSDRSKTGNSPRLVGRSRPSKQKSRQIVDGNHTRNRSNSSKSLLSGTHHSDRYQGSPRGAVKETRMRRGEQNSFGSKPLQESRSRRLKRSQHQSKRSPSLDADDSRRSRACRRSRTSSDDRPRSQSQESSTEIHDRKFRRARKGDSGRASGGSHKNGFDNSGHGKESEKVGKARGKNSQSPRALKGVELEEAMAKSRKEQPDKLHSEISDRCSSGRATSRNRRRRHELSSSRHGGQLSSSRHGGQMSSPRHGSRASSSRHSRGGEYSTKARSDSRSVISRERRTTSHASGSSSPGPSSATKRPQMFVCGDYVNHPKSYAVGRQQNLELGAGSNHQKSASSESPQKISTPQILQARSDRLDDIISFVKKKDDSITSKRVTPVEPHSSDGMLSSGKDGTKQDDVEAQPAERKTLLTATGHVAKVAIGVTALGAREVIGAISNPKKEMEKVVRLSKKVANKTAKSCANPMETVHKVSEVTKFISKGIVNEAKEVTVGTWQAGKDTVGLVAGIMPQGKLHSSQLDSSGPEMATRNIHENSLLDRVGLVLEDENQDGTQDSRIPKPVASSGFPPSIPSHLITNTSGKPTTTWEA